MFLIVIHIIVTALIIIVVTNIFVLPMHLQLMHHLIPARAPMIGVQQLYDSAPSVFLAKKIAGVKSQLRSKQSSKGPFPENFLATGGYFECNTYCAMALGWSKKERKKTILSFDHFRLTT